MSATLSAVPPRSDVPVAETWALEAIFPNEEAWNSAYEATGDLLSALEGVPRSHRRRTGTLLAALGASDALQEAVTKIDVFAQLRRAEDATDTRSGEMADRAIGLSARAGAAASFLEPEIAALSDETIAAWMSAEPRLEPYRHALERITRRRAHIRSTEVEEVLAQAAEVAATAEIAHSVLEDGELPLGEISDEFGLPIRLAQGNLQRYLDSTDRRVRQEAWERSADAYLAFRNTFAATLAGAVKRDVFYARAHGYDSSLASALSPDDIPTAVFYNLLDTVWRNFPVWHRYFNVRRRLLGLPEGELHGYDLEAPLAPQPDFPWERGVETILDSLAPLGPEYVAEVRRGMAERWVDRCANLGKGGGAFSSGVYGTEPFISMTWQDNLTSVSTLTHEIGHSMHSLLTWRHQPVIYSDYGMSAAETASNLNQALMGAHMLAERDDRDWTIAVIEERMANNMRYLFTMPILARFELAAHERVEAGEALSADWMSRTLTDFYRDGYGVRSGHRRAADGHYLGPLPPPLRELLRLPVRRRHLGRGGPGAGYPERRGASARALPQFPPRRRISDSIVGLRQAGVDMSSPEPIERAFAILSGYVDRLEALVDRSIGWRRGYALLHAGG